jgi:hypothetical protein
MNNIADPSSKIYWLVEGQVRMQVLGRIEERVAWSVRGRIWDRVVGRPAARADMRVSELIINAIESEREPQ